MKGTFFIALVVIFSMLVIPLSSLSKAENGVLQTAKPQSNIVYENKNQNVGFEKIKVLKDGVVIEVTMKDYVFGVVAAEMPALYENEALKAQAVAAYTFACYRKNNNTNTEYDISADPETAQCFITREEAASRWGEKADEYAKKIDDCISAVQGELLLYEGKPIFAAYHAISAGSTNACRDVWGNELSYLIEVESLGDKLADGYLSEAVFTTDELCEKLKDITSPSGEPQDYFSDISTTDNGYVKNLTYCGKQISGSEICKALELRSSNFEVDFADGKFTFLVKGYGHGVGMSQTGADYMAKQGSNYEEILLHYYNGVTLEKN
ncbi:MAG: stage II sporulation protein D [Clostridia bacterium]|nr:stage II sporulation protein D [Clostridia bacterium]